MPAGGTMKATISSITPKITRMIAMTSCIRLFILGKGLMG